MSDFMLGPYRMVAQVGEGGMGKVYLGLRADQQFEQKVAIKMAAEALQNQELALRFHLERQTLARLDHPNIVRLLDGGATPEGVPYLIMDHVDGIRLDHYVHEHNLSIRDRVELIRKICAAIQYAHQHLVVHRDIKPANILVTPDGEPKLLDFGIAKLLDSDPAGAALTSTGLVPMTLRYGSPEQIQGRPVTVATDLFALAVVLYELLSGHSPHYDENLSVETVMYRILKEDPAPPSSLSPQPREIAGDLDAIVLKALRKEPAERYASVSDFSEDLRRWLEGRPVLARQGTLLYRTRKFVGRHKAATIFSAVITAALLLAVGITVWQWHVARSERFLADARFKDVHQLARSFLFEFEAAIEKVPDSAAPRILLLKKTSEYLERLSRDATDPGVVLDIGETYLRLGSLQASAFQSSVGDVKAAEVAYRKAVAVEAGLLSQQPHNRQALDITARARLELSDILSSMGRFEESVLQARQAAEIFSDIAARDPQDTRALRDAGVAYLYLAGVAGGPDQLNLGDRKKAIDYTKSAIARYEQFIKTEPNGDVARVNTPLARLMLAYLLAADGATRQSAAIVPDVEAAFREMRTRSVPDELVAEFDEGLARIWQRLENHAKAVPYLAEAVALRQAAAQVGPRDSSAQFALAAILFHQGLTQAALKKEVEARLSFETAAGILGSLARRDTSNLLWMNGQVDALVEAGLPARALPLARQLAERPEATPNEVIRYARLLFGQDQPAAITQARRASQLAKQTLWDIEDDLAGLCAAAGNWKDALEAEGRAVALLNAYQPEASTIPYSRVLERFQRYQARVK